MGVGECNNEYSKSAAAGDEADAMMNWKLYGHSISSLFLSLLFSMFFVLLFCYFVFLFYPVSCSPS